MERTISVTINLENEMLTVSTLEGETGCMTEFGPTPIWSDWVNPLKEHIGNEIVSWVDLME